jgi:hypothetical protein
MPAQNTDPKDSHPRLTLLGQCYLLAVLALFLAVLISATGGQS